MPGSKLLEVMDEILEILISAHYMTLSANPADPCPSNSMRLTISLPNQEPQLMRYFVVLLTILVAAAAFAQENSPASSTNSNAILNPGFTVDTIDKSADPCTDFYQYACGNWMKHTEIPADQARWGTFTELQERNMATLRGILEKVSANDPNRNPIDQKIGDYYAACMDEKAVNEKGIAPLKPELDRIAAVKNKQQLIDAIARTHMLGTNTLFGFYSASDFHNADSVIAYIDQSGLTLPDRDYYLKTDARMIDMRKHYTDYLTETFMLTGQSAEEAADSAQSVLRIETELAQASMDRTARRDPKTRDHKMAKDTAEAMASNFHLGQYFADVNSPSFSDLNVANPEFFKAINAFLEKESLDSLKTYASWRLIDTSAPFLSQPFVDANFKMQQAITGQKEIQARWKRCVRATDRGLGEALGQRYVELTFGPDGKARMLKMVDALEKSLDQDIQQLPWMTEETKKQAKIKLDAIANKIGYPDTWRDYTSLTVVRGDLLGNYLRANEFESKRDINKIGKPLDRKEWGMTPPTVNAYYSSSENNINFPAGILQPPFFDKQIDDPVNFGAIGLVIGHELTHGFDDQGRKFDAQGNLHDWWTEQDGREFEKRASCIADEYSNFVSVDDLKLNGKLTLGENTADNGGARVSFNALETLLALDPSQASQKIDGYTPEQRYFLGFARVWCELRRPEFSRSTILTDPHSPGKFRVNGTVQNMPEFEKAWGCHEGQPMVSANACRVW
jgi:putative endopeptidase